MASKKSDQTFTFEQVSCVIAALLEKGGTLGGTHYALMKAVEDQKTVSGYEHLFRAAKARAKEIHESRGNLDISTPVKKTKASADKSPKTTGGKKRGRKGQSEQTSPVSEDDQAAAKRVKRTDSPISEEAAVKEEQSLD